MKQISDYELLDHGVDHAQYFQGCGTACTKFENVVTGCGDNFAEAIDDALEQIAMIGFDAEVLEAQIRVDIRYPWPIEPSASETFRKANNIPEEEDVEGNELYYYVSIRWNDANVESSAPQDYQPKYLKRWTRPANYAGATWPDYYSAGVGQSRDSGCLERSNFRSMLSQLGGECDTVIVVRESHWAVGWVEWIAIHKSDSANLELADDLKEKLNDYPVLDENDYSELETEEANETWQRCFDFRERVKYIRKHQSQFEFHDFADLRAVVRGDYFNGYASELIN